MPSPRDGRRWTGWMTALLGLAVGAAAILAVPESRFFARADSLAGDAPAGGDDVVEAGRRVGDQPAGGAVVGRAVRADVDAGADEVVGLGEVPGGDQRLGVEDAVEVRGSDGPLEEEQPDQRRERVARVAEGDVGGNGAVATEALLPGVADAGEHLVDGVGGGGQVGAEARGIDGEGCRHGRHVSGLSRDRPRPMPASGLTSQSRWPLARG